MRQRTGILAAVLTVMATLAQAAGTDASAPPGQALTLLQAWQAAAQHDRQLDVARAEQAAAASKRDQASALWKPSVFVNGSAGWGEGSTRMQGAQFSAPAFGTQSGVDFGTSVNNGTATRWGAELRQPLFSPARSAQRAQLDLAADLGDTGWQAARQGTMLQTAERYLALAVAQEKIRVLELQRQSTGRTMAEVHERFRLGMSPVTDTHEADAEGAGIQAQLAAAELDASVKRQALADSIGVPQPQAVLPSGAAKLYGLPPGSLESWLQEARTRNLQLLQRRQELDIAHQAVRARSPMADLSVDLVAQAGQDRLWGNGDFGPARNRNINRMIGVQVSIPLYTGGMRSAQEREATHQLEKAQAQLDLTQQQVELQVQSTWWGLQAGQTRLQALEQAEKAMRSRLDATRMGYSVGDRTTLDVLAAESAYANSAQALSEARSAQVLGRLRLAALANRLDDELLAQVSGQMGVASR